MVTPAYRRQRGMSLVELVVGIAIMSLVSTMILMGWFSLQKSYSYSVKSNVQRDSARQALSRMQREIRDAEARPLPNVDPAIYRARTYWIAVYTTFNVYKTASPTPQLNTDSGLAPHMVMYRLYSDGEIWRFDDLNNNGVIAGVNMDPSHDDPSGFNSAEQSTGEGAQLYLKYVTNYSADPAHPTPVFRYMYYDDSGTLVTEDHAYNWTDWSGVGHNDRSNTIAAIIRTLVDLVPGKAPVSADLETTAQIRNQR